MRELSPFIAGHQLIAVLRQAGNLRQGELGVGGWPHSLLPAVGLADIPERVHQNWAPCSSPPTSTHSFLTVGSTSRYSACTLCIWCFKLPEKKKKWFVHSLPFPLFIYASFSCSLPLPPHPKIIISIEHVYSSYCILGSVQTSAPGLLDNLSNRREKIAQNYLHKAMQQFSWKKHRSAHSQPTALPFGHRSPYSIPKQSLISYKSPVAVLEGGMCYKT